MDLKVNEPVRPLSSDDLIYTITACNPDEQFSIEDIVTVQWQNVTTGEEGEDSYLISKDASVNEAPLNPLLLMLSRSVGCLSTLEVSCQRRFLTGDESATTKQDVVVEFKHVDLRKSNTDHVARERHASKRQVLGNRHYGSGAYPKAIRSYNTALRILSDLPTRIDGIAFKCLNNLAACYMQQDLYDSALEVLRKVEEVDINNVKMLWRTGRALLQQGKCTEAYDYLSRANGLDANSAVIRRDLKKAEASIAEQAAAEREMYQKMVAGLAASAAEISEIQPEDAEEDGAPTPAEETEMKLNNTQMSIDAGSTSLDDAPQVEQSTRVDGGEAESLSAPEAETSFHFTEPELAAEETKTESESTTTEALLADRLNESFENTDNEILHGAGENILEHDLPTPVQSVEISSTTEEVGDKPSVAQIPKEETGSPVVDDTPAPVFTMITNREAADAAGISERKSSSFDDSAVGQSDTVDDGVKKEAKCAAFDEEGENACALPPAKVISERTSQDDGTMAMEEPTKINPPAPKSTRKSSPKKQRPEPATPDTSMLIMGGIAIAFVAILVAYFKLKVVW